MQNKYCEMLTNNFDSRSEGELDIICNVVFLLPIEYKTLTELTEEEYNALIEEISSHKPICYYVINNGWIEEENASFERPDKWMKQHFKPLFIWVKADRVGVNKVLFDGGATVNLMPHFLLKKIGKFDTNLRPHNMVLSNYEGKISYSLEVIEVNISVGTITRLTLIMVVASKVNYNLLLGREWIHGVGAVPLTLHQRISI